MASKMTRAVAGATLGLCGAVVGALQPAPASACGGLFCDAQTPVNQTAERILFVDEGDGKTTAAIEILYQGDAEKFAWVLPLGDIENPEQDIRVSSVLAMDRLQQATNPVYRLNRSVEGQCRSESPEEFGVPGSDGSAGDGDGDAAGAGGSTGGVTVEASGSVGPFDYEFISVGAGSTDPGQEAIDWLDENNYDLGFDATNNPLAPYLESGMKLLAIRLTKGNDVGSIRPLMVTYTGQNPSIPIKPTAVAAQDDMGVMVFVGSEHQAVPINYKALQLNDALIDWFNFASNYADVINAAADEAGGQGFVTEYADDSDTLQDVVVQQWERDEWMIFQGTTYDTDLTMFYDAQVWGGWDGYPEALDAALTLPATLSVQDVINCPSCYLDGGDEGVVLDRSAFRNALYEQVLRPMLDTEALVQSMPYVTRLYTTMSAPDMTLDPMFDQNPDIEDVDNNHTAEMVIECSPAYYQWEAPYRVELPSGLTVHGGDQNQWPVSLSTMDDEGNPLPAALRISEVGISGPKAVVRDNQALVQTVLDAMTPVRRPDTGGTGGDDEPSGGSGGMLGSDGVGGMSDGKGGGRSPSLCGCTVVGGQRDAKMPVLAASMLLLVLGVRRRRR